MFTMSITEFNRSISHAARLADEAPVTVTRRGKPAYVLMNIAEYQRLANVDPRPLSQRLAGPEGIDPDAATFERVKDYGRPIPGIDDDDDDFVRILDEIRTERDYGRPIPEFD